MTGHYLAAKHFRRPPKRCAGASRNGLSGRGSADIQNSLAETKVAQLENAARVKVQCVECLKVAVHDVVDVVKALQTKYEKYA